MVRDEVLHELETYRGSVVSGAALARELGVSRTAVWKAIAALREMGFEIESIPAGGYRLSSQSDTLSESGIELELATRHLARELCVLPEVDSTNNYIKRCGAGKPDGFAVVADAQTAGRGRLGRSFASPPGSGVYISVLLHPTLTAERINLITVGAAVAACEAIQETADFTPDIKWVNDVLMHGRKLCGILTEAAVEAESGRLSYAIVGIGINVRQPEGGLPEEIRDIAGCLEDFSPHFVRRNALVAAFFNHLEAYYQAILTGETEMLINRYRAFLHFLGEPITVIRGEERSRAVAVAVNEQGHLIIEQDGQRSELIAGEISIRVPGQQSDR